MSVTGDFVLCDAFALFAVSALSWICFVFGSFGGQKCEAHTRFSIQGLGRAGLGVAGRIERLVLTDYVLFLRLLLYSSPDGRA